MKQITLSGLFIMMIGGFLPQRTILFESNYWPFWLFPLLGILLMFLIKDGSLDNRRIGGIVALFAGINALCSMVDTLSMPFAAGFSVGKGIPVTIFGCVFACLGGFSKPVRVNSPLYNIGLSFILLGFAIVLVLGSYVSFYYSQLFQLTFSQYRLLNEVGYIALVIMFIGGFVVLAEFVKTFDNR